MIDRQESSTRFNFTNRKIEADRRAVCGSNNVMSNAKRMILVDFQNNLENFILAMGRQPAQHGCHCVDSKNVQPYQTRVASSVWT